MKPVTCKCPKCNRKMNTKYRRGRLVATCSTCNKSFVRLKQQHGMTIYRPAFKKELR